MKKLKKYLDAERGRQGRLAEAAKCRSSTIARLADGTLSDPRVSVALAIEKATSGEITVYDWK